MIYKCRDCYYLFDSKTKPLTCPDCGKGTINIANESEIAEYERNREEFSKGGGI